MRSVRLLADYDPILNELLKDEHNKIKYFSWKIQNELIDLLATNIRSLICEEIRHSQCFSIIMDSTQDITKLDQVSIVIRYVVINHNELSISIKESFLGFFVIEKHGAQDYEELITNILLKLNIDINKCRGQGYDGASVMSGVYTGVQKRIKDKVPTASYVHCCAHNLNLVISDAAKSSQKVVSFFETVQAVFNFFSVSAPRWASLAFGDDESRKIKSKVLKKVCPTRWESRHESINALKLRFIDILKSLTNISLTSVKKDEKASSLSLKKKLGSMEFVLILCIWEKILRALHGVSKSLQNPSTNLHNACQNLKEVKTVIENLRDNYKNILLECKELCSRWGISPNFYVKRIRFASQYFDEIDGDRRLNITDENFMVKIFLPVIDTVIFQLNSRFQGLQKVTENFDFLFPTVLTKLDENEISKASMDFFHLYNDDISPDFTRKLLCLRGLLNTKIQTIKDLVLFIIKNDFCTTYCDVLTACIIYISLPVTVAMAERSFSKLKLIKNYLRNSMGQNRLSNIAILNIEKDETNKLDLEKIISTFADCKTRKKKLPQMKTNF